MASREDFSGYEIRLISGQVWRAGGPNSAASAQSADVKVSSLCLTAGDPYEVEGVMASNPGQARALAIVQDLFRVKRQLTAPVTPELLYERRPPRVTCLKPIDVPALFAIGKAAEERLGFHGDFGSRDIEEEAELRRRTVRGFRADGWHAAIVLPGFGSDASMVVMPRIFLQSGALRVGWTGRLSAPVPAPLVDFALGLRREFPIATTVGGLPLARSPQRVTTISWRSAEVPDIQGASRPRISCGYYTAVPRAVARGVYALTAVSASGGAVSRNMSPTPPI